MREHRLDLVAGHTLQQPGADGDQRRVAPCAGGKGVHVRRRVDRDLGRLDAGLSSLAFDDAEQPRLDFIARLSDHLRTRRALGHPFRHRQRDERAAEADHERQHQQRLVVDASTRLVEYAVDAQQPEHDAEHQDDGQVGGQEQGNSFEHLSLSPRLQNASRYDSGIAPGFRFFKAVTFPRFNEILSMRGSPNCALSQEAYK